MDDNQFLQSLHSRFVDVKVPESLLPEHVAERLKKKPRVTIVENTKRFVAVAAIFAIIVISSILTIGPILIDSADFSIEPAQNSDSYELQSDIDISDSHGSNPTDTEQAEDSNSGSEKNATHVMRSILILSVALVLMIGIVIWLLILPAYTANRNKRC